MSRHAIIDLVLREEQKHNAKASTKGRKIAHANVAERVRGIIWKEDKRTGEKKLDENFIRRVNLGRLYEELVINRDLEENLTVSAFPVIAGEMISSVIVDGYESFPKTGLSLVRVVPSKRQVSQIPGWKAIGRAKKLNEREPYPEIDPPSEKWFAIPNAKHGAKLSLTKESFTFDQTGRLVDRAREIGEELARSQDEEIWTAIRDASGTAYQPNGVATALYSAGNNNLLPTNPLGTDGWEKADQKLTDQIDDNTGKPVWVLGDRPVMAVSSLNKHNAWKLRNNDRGELGSANLDRNPAQNAFDFVLDPYNPGSGDWWYGSFRRQFRWEEVWAMETFSRVGQNTEEGFNADVIQQFKASYYGGAGAVDTRYVIKNTP